MKKAILIYLTLQLGLVLFACYTPPVVRVSDTTAQQEEIKRVQNELVKVPDAPGNQIAPRDRATIYQAGDALYSCGSALQRLDERLNLCAAQMNQCGEKYKTVSADLKQCESENSFFGNLWRDIKVFGLGTLLGLVLSIFGPIIFGLIKASLKIA